MYSSSSTGESCKQGLDQGHACPYLVAINALILLPALIHLIAAIPPFTHRVSCVLNISFLLVSHHWLTTRVIASPLRTEKALQLVLIFLDLVVFFTTLMSLEFSNLIQACSDARGLGWLALFAMFLSGTMLANIVQKLVER